MTKNVMINNFPYKEHSEMKIHCATYNTTMRAFIIEAIAEKLEKSRLIRANRLATPAQLGAPVESEKP